MSPPQGAGKPPRLLDADGRRVTPWRPPVMDAPAEAGDPPVPPPTVETVTVEEMVTPPPALPTAEEIEAIQREAWEEGYRAGHAEGLAAGQETITAQVARWEALIASLTQPLETVEGELEAALLELALALARQIIRREMKTQPDEIIPVVREALSALPATAREVVVHLHPEDAALVRATIHSPGATWRIEEDATLTRGDCLVLTPTSRVDATLERRIAQLFASVLGEDERGSLPRLGEGA